MLMADKHWNDVNQVAMHLKAHCLAGLLSIDIEGRAGIGAIGAVHVDPSTTQAWRGDEGRLRSALTALDAFADGTSHLVGHNIIEHDLGLPAKRAPDLALLCLPAIDPLYLSPLAFPENPYHHLVNRSAARMSSCSCVNAKEMAGVYRFHTTALAAPITEVMNRNGP